MPENEKPRIETYYTVTEIAKCSKLEAPAVFSAANISGVTTCCVSPKAHSGASSSV